MTLDLSAEEQAMREGDLGPAIALAMRVICRTGDAMRAERLLAITGAHIDSCLFHGQAGLDFAARLASDGARVKVPTTLNVASLDLVHPELFRGPSDTGAKARELMSHYETMGCQPTWTCAPYQLDNRPSRGEHVAWAESNAIVFANSVLGARTHRYGDFIDICAAITGRAPAAGLHLDENRMGQVVFDLGDLPQSVIQHGLLAPVLGHFVGGRVGALVPVIHNAPNFTEDQMKSFGSAAASSGSVGIFHVVGVTPEADTLHAALGGQAPQTTITVTLDDLRRAWGELSTTSSEKLGAVSLGTPHYSIREFDRLLELLGSRQVDPRVHFYVNTGRGVAAELALRGWLGRLEKAGVQLVTDTCTYITPVMSPFDGAAMTDSPKWAYYAPGNLGVEVVFGSTEACVESAVAGRVVGDTGPW